MSGDRYIGACSLCGRPCVSDACEGCAASLENPSIGFFGVQPDDGSHAARWFGQPVERIHDTTWTETHAGAHAEGVFNVEGGYVAVGGRPFAVCDCNYTHSVREVCTDCGRGPGNLVTCLAGLGDGTYPVWSVCDQRGEFTGAVASLAPWLATDFESGWRNLRLGMQAAKPLVLGFLKNAEYLDFSDASPDFIISLDDIPTDDYVVVAWIDLVTNPFLSQGQGGGQQRTGLRPIAIAAYRGMFRQTLLESAFAADDPELHHIIADLWGNVFQLHASHAQRRSMSEMAAFNAEAPITNAGYGGTTKDSFAAIGTFLIDREVVGSSGAVAEYSREERAILARLLVKHGMADEGFELLCDEVSSGNTLALQYAFLLHAERGAVKPVLELWQSTDWPSVDAEIHSLAKEAMQQVLGLSIARAIRSEDRHEALRLYELARTEHLEWDDEVESTMQSLSDLLAKREQLVGLQGALVKLQAGDADGAYTDLLPLAEGGDGIACTYLGLILADRGRRDDARSWWERGAANGSGLAMRSLGTLAHNEGRFEESLAWFEKGAEFEDSGCMWIVANNLHSIEQFADARLMFEKVVALNEEPEHVASSINTLAFSYLIPDHQFDEAEQLLQRAIALGVPYESTNAKSNLGIVFFERGDLPRARLLFEEALTAGDGPNDEIREYLKRISEQVGDGVAQRRAAMRFCTQCGTPRGAGFKFCGNCGFAFYAS